jgi:hypothetical protein
VKNYKDLGTPLTICMWDFSWLSCGHPGGAFEELERRVAETAERGYNTLRVDVFPNLYAEEESYFRERAEKRRVGTWGEVRQEGGYRVKVRQKVKELAEYCRKYNLWLGLDTWQSGHIVKEERVPLGGEEAAARQVAAAWTNALPMMRDDGVLDRAVWVAPLNEVPLFLGRKLECVRVSDPEQRHEGMTKWRSDLPELDKIFYNINLWLGESVKEVIEGDGIPLSYSALGAENYADRLPNFYDVVDVHFMPDILQTPEDSAALEKAGKGASKFSLHPRLDTYNLEVYSNAWAQACRNNYRAMLRLCKDYAENALGRTTLPSGKQLDAVVTEAYGPCNFPDVPEVDWSMYYQYNADAARIFAMHGYSGLTVSNHAEPIFAMWDEKELQLRTNEFIMAAIEKSK